MNCSKWLTTHGIIDYWLFMANSHSASFPYVGLQKIHVTYYLNLELWIINCFGMSPINTIVSSKRLTLGCSKNLVVFDGLAVCVLKHAVFVPQVFLKLVLVLATLSACFCASWAEKLHRNSIHSNKDALAWVRSFHNIFLW